MKKNDKINTTKKHSNKLFSRKFQVWLVWTILTIVSLFLIVMETEVKTQIIQFYGWVSLIYVGGNVAQKYIDTNANSISNDNAESVRNDLDIK